MTETVGFTGARRLGTADYAQVVEIVKALPEGARIVAGGCIGVDDYVSHIGHSTGRKVHIVLPSDRSRVASGWQDVCDTFEEMPAGTDYRARNQRIVDLSDRLIAIPEHDEHDPLSRRSGTWMTIRIARKAGKQVDTHVLCGECRSRRPPPQQQRKPEHREVE